jgi:hypothetical protein
MLRPTDTTKGCVLALGGLSFACVGGMDKILYIFLKK